MVHRTRQITIAFSNEVSVADVASLLRHKFGRNKVIVGKGKLVDGIPPDWIVVEND
jgi:hypothetical protein